MMACEVPLVDLLEATECCECTLAAYRVIGSASNNKHICFMGIWGAACKQPISGHSMWP